MSKQNRVNVKTGKTRSRIFSLSLIVTAAIVATTLFWPEPAHEANAAETTAGTTKELPEITVYKSPTCGCCTDWEVHLEKEGFKVISHKRTNMDSIKKKLGVKSHLASCHTATIDGYVIEGHVPADDIKRLLKEKTETAGLTAPGMPQHSPGMQPPGEKPRGYSVLMFDKDGKTRVFTRY